MQRIQGLTEQCPGLIRGNLWDSEYGNRFHSVHPHRQRDREDKQNEARKWRKGVIYGLQNINEACLGKKKDYKSRSLDFSLQD